MVWYESGTDSHYRRDCDERGGDRIILFSAMRETYNGTCHFSARIEGILGGGGVGSRNIIKQFYDFDVIFFASTLIMSLLAQRARICDSSIS